VTSRLVLNADGEFEKIPAYRLLWLSKLVYSSAFELFIAAVIAINAVFLAVLTIPGITDNTRELAIAVDTGAMVVYAVELALRIASYGRKPWMFFTRGWNVFDFIVVGLAPFAAGQTVVLRLLRLMRLLRIFRFLPEVRVLFASIVKSLPPLLSMSVLIGLMLFLYGMAGTYLFGTTLYDSWGHIGLSLKSLFILLTLENFPQYLEEAMLISPWALPYFLSYVFLIVFTILNVLIGIVLNAMDEARKENRVQNVEAEAVDKLHHIITAMSADGKISSDELDQLKRDVVRLRKSLPS
jgi:voltage-gated sodium channel